MDNIIIGIICIVQLNLSYTHRNVYQQTAAVEQGTQIINSLNYFVEILPLMPGRQIIIMRDYHVEIICLCHFELYTLLANFHRWKYQPDENFCYKPPWLIINISYFHEPSKFYRRKPPWLFLYIMIQTVASDNGTPTCHRRLPVLSSASFFASSERQLNLLLLLLMLQTVQALYAHTFSLLNTIFTVTTVLATLHCTHLCHIGGHHPALLVGFSWCLSCTI
jgi:hypothetical protein